MGNISVRKLKLAIVNDNANLRNEQYSFIKREIFNQYRGLNLCMGILASSFYMDNIKSGNEQRLLKKISNDREKLKKERLKLEKLHKDLDKKSKSIDLLNSKTKLKSTEESKLIKGTETIDKGKEQIVKLEKEIRSLEKNIHDTELQMITSEDFRSDLANKFDAAYAKDLYQVLGSVPFEYLNNKSLVSRKVQADLKNGILKGDRSVRNYKKDTFLMTDERLLKFSKVDNEYYINWINHICFKIVIGKKDKDKKELVSTLEKILTGEYKVNQSSLGFNDKKDLMINLTFTIPSAEIKPDATNILGVDLGINIPAYVALGNNTYVRKAFGSKTDFLKVREQFRARKRRVQKQLELAKGGKGRKDKLSSLNQFRDKERKWANTYNHQISKGIIKFAVKNNVGQINMEKLEKDGFDNKLLGMWSYYELQNMIEYKAQRESIVVKYVDPAYTSQTCSKCGHVDKDNRKSQEHFECIRCGHKLNADHNASINIARSEEYK